MFSSRLPLSALLELCRSLKHYLGAGLTLVDAFAHQAKRGAGAMSEVSGLIATDRTGSMSNGRINLLLWQVRRS